ncbi:MAG: hypothetical protein P8J79_04730 [Halioglobus sp.]|nr:hypothetical protein [Halioglobus sp.]
MLDIKMILLVTLSVLTALEVLAERPWPEKVFECQIVTASGASGLVGLQTFSLNEAEDGVVGLTATTLLGNKESAVRVVQCVEQGRGQSFKDQNFQAWVDGLPR